MGVLITKKLFMITTIIGYMPSVTGSSTISSNITVIPRKHCIGMVNIRRTSSIDQHRPNAKICYVAHHHQCIIMNACYANQVFLAKSDTLIEPCFFLDRADPNGACIALFSRI